MIVVDLPVPGAVDVEPILQFEIIRGGETSRRRIHVPVLDLLRHCQERLLDIRGVLRRGLEEGDVKLVREFLWEVL